MVYYSRSRWWPRRSRRVRQAGRPNRVARARRRRSAIRDRLVLVVRGFVALVGVGAQSSKRQRRTRQASRREPSWGAAGSALSPQRSGAVEPLAAGDAKAGGLPRSSDGTIMSTFTYRRDLRARACFVLRRLLRLRFVTEQDHIDSIRKALPENGRASSRHIGLADEALRQYSDSTRLWCLRGDLIQLSDEVDDGRDLSDAQRSYERALTIDASCIEAHESLGYFLDAVMLDAKRARHHFDQAARLSEADPTPP